MNQIIMYSSDYCPFCMRAKSLLHKKGLNYQEINVDRDRALRQEMTQKSGKTSVPQIWIGEQHIGGCDEIHALERSGSLDQILNQDKAS